MRLREFSLDLASHLSTARGDITERRGFLVGVERASESGGERGGEGGRAGRGAGEATPLPGWTESYETCRDALVDVQEAATRGEDVDLDGLPPAARHAVSLVSADAAARREGVPLSGWLAEHSGTMSDLGDGPADAVPVNATVGDGSVTATVDAAEDAVADGYDCLKLKVGARPLDADLARLRAVRDAVGDAVAIRADANGGWDRETAARAVESLAALDVVYVEQPLPADDRDGLAALRGRGVGIALDESVNRRGARLGVEAIEACADVAVLKPMAQGGPGATVALARHLRSRGVEPVVTTTVDGAVARAAAVHAAAAIPEVAPCGLATGDLLADDLDDGPDPVPVADGRIAVPSGPGTLGDRYDDLLWG